jgi:hypothetical protein
MRQERSAVLAVRLALGARSTAAEWWVGVEVPERAVCWARVARLGWVARSQREARQELAVRLQPVVAWATAVGLVLAEVPEPAAHWELAARWEPVAAWDLVAHSAAAVWSVRVEILEPAESSGPVVRVVPHRLSR